MVNISKDSIVSRLNPKKTVIVDASGGGSYQSIETALSSETSSGTAFIVAATGPYSPSGNISLSSEQMLIGHAYPTISGVSVDAGGSNAQLIGVEVDGGLINASGAGARVEFCRVLGSASSDVSGTTMDVTGGSAQVRDLYSENRRLVVDAARARVVDCEITGGVTSSYSSPSNYDELEVLNSNNYVAGNVVEGGVNNAGSGTIPATLTNQNHVVDTNS